ncbi:histidine phosphotransferase family protein [Yoonia vestfoldensis]|uniref:Histidine phosphotransferase n=1 Tax=Yoonia vestfoldensis TaxID=245188 RepID=A0A1Y0EAV5_9RHOB|nr:histidine phosphotransferase family protein [Yoonia vestfoldensis]ARU00755.1 histidine phosphotransferase [Yoonia vestfoldensis]
MRPNLASLVGSRICHDLISPIGAIGNGLELLALTDGDPGAEMELIADSVQNASARIRFYRIAYGAASADQLLGSADILPVISVLARGGRFTYFWQVAEPRPRREVRCALLLLQCFEAAMPVGGDIHVSVIDNRWVLSAESLRFTIDPGLWDSLANGGDASYVYSAAQVQFALLPDMLHEAERDVQIKMSSDRIVASF